MSSIYRDAIHEHLIGIEKILCVIVEKNYSCRDEDEGTMTQAKLLKGKQEAVKAISGLCSAIEQKAELLNYKLQIIKTFDWRKDIDFERYKTDSKDRSVEQVLQNGNFRVKFLQKETMLNFIYTEISSFFSTISSIIDNIAEILYYTFKLDFGYMRTIKNIVENLQDGDLKDFIQRKFCDDYGFYGVREIRRIFEHKNHIDVIHIDHLKTRSLFGKEKEVIIARINVDLMETGLPPELNSLPNGNKIDNYCAFLYEKISEVLKEFIVEVSKV